MHICNYNAKLHTFKQKRSLAFLEFLFLVTKSALKKGIEFDEIIGILIDIA